MFVPEAAENKPRRFNAGHVPRPKQPYINQPRPLTVTQRGRRVLRPENPTMVLHEPVKYRPSPANSNSRPPSMFRHPTATHWRPPPPPPQQYQNYRQKPRAGFTRTGYIPPHENHSNNRDPFRRANRPLIADDAERWDPMASPQWALDAMGKQCLEVSEAFIMLDNYLDEVKTYNSSNIEELKKKRMEELIARSESPDKDPGEFEEQIRCCKANPDKFSATWDALVKIFGEVRLEEYVKKKAWSPEELESSKISLE